MCAVLQGQTGGRLIHGTYIGIDELIKVYQGDTLHDLYNTHQMIGTGKFSIVYRCTQKHTGKMFALKNINTEKLTTQTVSTLDNQSQIMKIITHPNIVNYKETLRSKQHIYIITEYIYGKDLYEYTRKKKRLGEYMAAFIIGKVIEAVMYIHSIDIIHRDLKPDNIMIMFKKDPEDMDNYSLEGDFSNKPIKNVKIIDFGLSNHVQQLQKNHESQGIAGTPNYISPEVVLGQKPSFKSDNFAIGSILYFLLSGKMAFVCKDIQYTLLQTARGEYNLNTGVWQTISHQAKDLIKCLLQVDPDKRISLEEALNHKWFEEVAKQKGNKHTVSTKGGSIPDVQEPNMEELRLKQTGSLKVGEIILKQRMSRKSHVLNL